MPFDLDSMKQEWRRGANRTIGAEELAKIEWALRTQTRRMRLLLGLEIVGTMCCFVLFFWLARQADSGTGRVFYGLLAAASIPLQVWSVRLRGGLWRAVQETPTGYLRLQADRARLNIRIARWTLIGTPVGFVLGLATGYWGPSSGAWRLLSVYILLGIALGATAVVLLIAWVAWRTLVRQRLVLETTQRLRAELEN
jgi:hypothetical protein